MGQPFSAVKQTPGFNADVYMLDIGLPGMDGDQRVKQLRQLDTNNGRFITVTGYGQCKDKERALAAGFDVHFTIPLNPKCCSKQSTRSRPLFARISVTTAFYQIMRCLACSYLARNVGASLASHAGPS